MFFGSPARTADERPLRVFIPVHDHNPIGHIRRPWVNYGLITVTVVVFLMTGTSGDTVLQEAAFSLGLVPSIVNDFKILPEELVLIPQDLSYLSYAFLHTDLLHLGGNMLFLWVFGDNIEDATGHVRYLVFYLLCAAAAGFGHTLLDPQSELPLIGASGAVSGIVGAYLMLHPRVRIWVLLLGRIPLRLSATIVLGAWLAYQIFNLFISLTGDTEVSWVAHVGGFAAGAALIVVLKRRDVMLFDRDLTARQG